MALITGRTVDQLRMTTAQSTVPTRSSAACDEVALARLVQLCVGGDRVDARNYINSISQGQEAIEISKGLYWPAMQVIYKMERHDQLTRLAYQYASRILRMLVDQAQAHYEQAPRNGRRLLCVCGPNEAEDMAGQLCADLLEAAGYEVLFAAGGVANDEILQEVGQRRPDALVVFAAAASDAPQIRMLIDAIRTVGAAPDMPIICGGGVFSRAPGLAEEIGADATADDPQEIERMVRCALASPRIASRRAAGSSASGSHRRQRAVA